MNKLVIVSALAVLGSAANAQIILLTNPGSHSENFDSLATTGTTNAWADSTTIAGAYAAKAVAPNAITTYRAGTGSDTAGALYSFGSTGSGERALGSVASGTPGDIFFGFRYRNQTGGTLTQVTITFTGEQWRNGGNTTAQKLEFGYALDPTQTGTINGAGYTLVSGLDFTGPIASATAGALDGNATANRVVGITSTITGLNWQNGQDLWVRWRDANDAGNDHGLAIDNYSMSAVPEPASMIALGLGISGLIARRRRS